MNSDRGRQGGGQVESIHDGAQLLLSPVRITNYWSWFWEYELMTWGLS